MNATMTWTKAIHAARIKVECLGGYGKFRIVRKHKNPTKMALCRLQQMRGLAGD
jgi:hypothetical protein